MFRKLLTGALGAMAVLFSTTAFAQGTAADAKAMLEKTVAAIKADKTKTLDQINKGENGFLMVTSIRSASISATDSSLRSAIPTLRGCSARMRGHLRTLRATCGKRGPGQ